MEAWRKRIAESPAGQWADALQLEYVELDESGLSMKITLSCEKPLPDEALQEIEQTFSEAMPDNAKIELSLNCVALEKDFCERFDEYLPALKEEVLQWQPELKSYLANSVWSLDKKTLFISFKHRSALHLCKIAQVEQRLETYLKNNHSCERKVSVRVEEEKNVVEFTPLTKPAPPKKENYAKRNFAQKKSNAFYGKIPVNMADTSMDLLSDESGQFCVVGEVFSCDQRETRDGQTIIVIFSITDYRDSISCKLFLKKKLQGYEEILDSIKKGKWLRVYGDLAPDKFMGNDPVLTVSGFDFVNHPSRQDTAKEKRVELHLHTQMSTMDSTISMRQLIENCKAWGHDAVAVTDHGVVQAFPQFYDMANKAGIKAIFGMEGYLADDSISIPIGQNYVVFDLETTGLNPKHCHITEIGAVKIEEGKVTERFSSFVNPGVPIPKEITDLTGITNEMVADAPTTAQVLKDFQAFCGEAILVAHNASFDMKFIIEHGMRYDIEFENLHADTLQLARYLLRDLEHHRLNDLTEYFNVSLENHHRADCDAEATGLIFLRLLDMLKERGINELSVVTSQQRNRSPKEKNRYYHIIFLVKDQQGLENLYKLVSYSHLNHFRRRPTIPRSLLCLHREGLIVGSACASGELYEAVAKGEPEEKLLEMASFYDYLEIQPIHNNDFMLRNGMAANEEVLRDHNRTIAALAEKLNKPCAATSDAHFAEPRDAVYREILMGAQKFEDAAMQPPIYMKTTDEMLAEFAYLGTEKAYEVVVSTTQKIAEQCQMLRPFPKETCQPLLEGAEEELVSSTYERAHAIYGEDLPEIVKSRIERELSSITGYGFSVLYVIARKLVLKSNKDGYLVGSRGSVGSSVVAYFSGITEVNALSPHYVCPNCKHSDFDVDLSQYSCGCDLPDQNCPECGTQYIKDGYNIPFETFLGFEGDKVPDIDLNFSGDYQPRAHKYTEVLFGKGYVFRAGTISGVQEKTAYGYVKKYCEDNELIKRRAEMERLALGCCGVKRTTGQHPGGIVVVPKDRTVFEFTPLQHPADKEAAGSITTHFDFNSMHDTLVKLDILGHDDPTMIRMLQDLTGIDPKEIPLDDPDTMSLFSSVSALGLDPRQLGSEVGTYGVPEFGTSFVRRMLLETKPTTMEELVRISGLSHGTDVWTNNAQDLVRAGTATLSEAICTRDDIMTYLIMCGLDKKLSFDIMERVRKGKGLSEEMELAMREKNVPEWYIASCQKIKYMFPRAHAAAYVMMAFRIAYCKVHHPLAYYASYFTVRADAFDIAFAAGGADVVARNIKAIHSKGLDATTQEKSLLLVLEVVLEMNLRGFEFENIDIMRSDATKFLITQNGTALLPPFTSLAGLGEKAARSIAEAREGGPFSSKEDMMQKAKIGQSTIALFDQIGCLGDMPNSDQISFF